MARQLENSFRRTLKAERTTASTLTIAASAVLVFGACVAAAFTGSLAGGAILGVAAALISLFATISERDGRISAALLGGDKIVWESTASELQRRNVEVAASEIVQKLSSANADESETRSAMVIATDLAFRQIQSEERAALLRNVAVAGVPFDAAFVKGDTLVCCEAAFLVRPEISQERLSAMLRKAAAVDKAVTKKAGRQKIRLMPVIITQMNEQQTAELRRSLHTARFAATAVDIDIRLLDFDELQRTYLGE